MSKNFPSSSTSSSLCRTRPAIEVSFNEKKKQNCTGFVNGFGFVEEDNKLFSNVRLFDVDEKSYIDLSDGGVYVCDTYSDEVKNSVIEILVLLKKWWLAYNNCRISALLIRDISFSNGEVFVFDFDKIVK